MRVALILVLLALGACSEPQAVTLRDPATKQIVECRAFPDTFGQSSYIETCAQKYERSGFQRMK